ncbi:MAG TPA: hypothetical protein VEA40_26550 [Ramlibacter sp.]|nr:hypothetical protein [Ramlibacter sp.]
MNRQALIAIASLAAVASFGVRAEAPAFSHWTVDAPTAQAFPSLSQGAAAGNTRAVARTDAPAALPVASVHQWSPDASTADAFPALRQAPAATASREQVRAQVLSGTPTISEREGA